MSKMKSSQCSISRLLEFQIVNERREYNSIGRNDFYRKSHKICSCQNIIFRGLTFYSFSVQLVSFVERNITSTIKHYKIKSRKT